MSVFCSFTLPMVIIGLVMVGNQLMYGDLGYPHTYMCFIRRSLSRQLGFGLPVGLAVVFNIVMFFYTTIHIHRLPDTGSTRQNQVSLVACFRLSVITGLTWLSLFMLSVPGTRPWLEYVSVLLLGLQGLLLATTLLINKRVFSLWQDFFR